MCELVRREFCLAENLVGETSFLGRCPDVASKRWGFHSLVVSSEACALGVGHLRRRVTRGTVSRPALRKLKAEGVSAAIANAGRVADAHRATVGQND